MQRLSSLPLVLSLFFAGNFWLGVAGASSEDFEVLTRGPVHEAFAEAVTFTPEPGIIIDVEPPQPIEELPPEQQLEGDDVVWIPGYWVWDEEQNDFLWVSGIWRNLPPDRQWIPGYWSDLGDGSWQWTAGYWEDASVEEVAYIATVPPVSIDAGPNIPAPSVDHTWIPGVWRWQDTRYLWRPGYWTPLRTDWTWVPARYCWTPRGYVFVDGYWDHAFHRRGVLFAPVHFRRQVWASPGYYYTPSIVVTVGGFLDHLFYRPRTCHYYFGDYYDRRYRSAGFYSAYSWHHSRRGYEPIFAHRRWDHRHDRGWERNYRERYDYRRSHIEARPPRTWANMRQLRGRRGHEERVFASPLSEFASVSGRGERFRALDDNQRRRIASERRDVRSLKEERRRVEARPVVAQGEDARAFTRERRSRSPIVGRRADRFESGQAPPARPEARNQRIPQREREVTRRTERRPEARSTPESQRQTEARRAAPQREPQARGKAATPSRPQARSTPQPQRQTEARRAAPQREPQARGRAAAPSRPQARSTPQPQRQTEARRAAPQREPQARSRAAPQARPQARSTPQPQRQTEARRAAPQREPQARGRAAAPFRPQARSTPQPQRQTEARRATSPREPQARSRAATPSRPQARSRPQPQRQTESRRATPQRQPQARSRASSQSRAQARPTPRRQPESRRAAQGRNGNR